MIHCNATDVKRPVIFQISSLRNIPNYNMVECLQINFCTDYDSKTRYNKCIKIDLCM